jgi:early secretory antigenic target protein ESAT-6
MADITVAFESLASGADGIRNNYAKLNSTLDDLEKGLQPMVNSWSGAAQESYIACKKQWEDASHALALVLQNIGQAVQQAHQNYTSAENSARQNWA